MVAVARVAVAGPDPFAPCAAKLADDPDGIAWSGCLFDVALETGQFDDAARRLDRHVATHRDVPHLELMQGNLEAARGHAARAEERWRAAMRHFDAARDDRFVRGRLDVRSNLAGLLRQRGRDAEAGALIEEARAIAVATGDRRLIASVGADLAMFLWLTDGDLARAHDLALAADRDAGNDTAVRQTALQVLGSVATDLGRHDDAIRWFRELVEHTDRARNIHGKAGAELSLARALVGRIDATGAGDLDAARRQIDAALADATRSHNQEIEAGALLLGAEIDVTGSGAAVARLERCLAIARDADIDLSIVGGCRRALAEELRRSDPRRAATVLDAELADARATANLYRVAHAAWTRARLVDDDAAAIAASTDALAAIEDLRELQPDAVARGGMMTGWVPAYTQLAGRLLARGDVAGGLGVIERLRGRILLETLDAQGVTRARAAADSPSSRLLAEAQRLEDRLIDPELDDAGRADLVRAIERARDAARRSIAADPVHRPHLSALAEIQAALATDEVMVSFQLARERSAFGDLEGGSWAIAITHDGARARALGDGRRIENAARVLGGLVRRRDGADAATAARLGELLFGPGLADLPPRVRRVIVVPDGALHGVPFGALRRSAAARPLVADHEVVVTPSATLWLRWRTRSLPRPRRAVLVLADPEPGAQQPALGRLPQARREASAAVAALPDTTRWIAGDAAESRLRAAELSRWSVIHLAAHAVVVESDPARSAVLLTPGDGADGRLEPPEIGGLRLDGQVIVLAACTTAGGAELRGEGVASLARAFLEAGADSVVATLWPLRDDDAAALFAAFYRGLAAGMSTASALAAAQRERIRASAPALAWAGVVVIGDGDGVPHDRVARARPPIWPLAAPGVALLVIGVALGVARARRRRVTGP